MLNTHTHTHKKNTLCLYSLSIHLKCRSPVSQTFHLVFASSLLLTLSIWPSLHLPSNGETAYMYEFVLYTIIKVQNNSKKKKRKKNTNTESIINSTHPVIIYLQYMQFYCLSYNAEELGITVAI